MTASSSLNLFEGLRQKSVHKEQLGPIKSKQTHSSQACTCI